MVDRIVAAIGSNGDDLGFAGCASLLVLHAVGFGWIVSSKLVGANDDLQVCGLVQTFGFAGIDAGNNGFDRDVCVSPSDCSSRWVVGTRGAGLDIGDVLAPFLHQGGWNWGESRVDASHISLGIGGPRNLWRRRCSKGRGSSGARDKRRRRC